MTLLLIIIAPIAIGLLTAGISMAIRRTAMGSRVSLPWTLVALHTAILIPIIALYPTGIFTPDVPYDDVYAAYFFVPGFHIYWPGILLAQAMKPLLRHTFSAHLASVFGVVLIPGFTGVVLGGIQWYLIGWMLTKRNAASQRAIRPLTRNGPVGG